MAGISSESPGEDPDRITLEKKIPKISGFVEKSIPWVDYTLEQAQLAQETLQSTVENAIEYTRSRFDTILATSTTHIDLTLDSMQGIKSNYRGYEDYVFGKIKEGFLLSSSHPWMTTGPVVALGIVCLKRTRQFVYYSSMRFFLSEEALRSRADAKVNELRQSVELLRSEAEKLEKRAMQAEEDFVRGRTKLRQAGKHILSSINSAYKIERREGGLKDVLKDIPSREASRFRIQVTQLAKDAKRERNILSKEVAKLSNYGITV